MWRRSGVESSRWLYVVPISVVGDVVTCKLSEVYDPVSGDSHLSRGLFFQPTKSLFVAGTYDLLENLGEVLEQFHGLSAQHWTLLCRHNLAL